jgi:uncharacterized membrane protein (GlpM family)
VGLALWLAPAIALACPSCAQGNDGGTRQTIVLGLFVFFPFVVAGAVYFFVKSVLRADARSALEGGGVVHAVSGEK